MSELPTVPPDGDDSPARPERCETCQFWDGGGYEGDDFAGECHRGLRHVSVSNDDTGCNNSPPRNGLDWSWPVHFGDDWCGEWKETF